VRRHDAKCPRGSASGQHARERRLCRGKKGCLCRGKKGRRKDAGDRAQRTEGKKKLKGPAEGDKGRNGKKTEEEGKKTEEEEEQEDEGLAAEEGKGAEIAKETNDETPELEAGFEDGATKVATEGTPGDIGRKAVARNVNVCSSRFRSPVFCSSPATCGNVFGDHLRSHSTLQGGLLQMQVQTKWLREVQGASRIKCWRFVVGCAEKKNAGSTSLHDNGLRAVRGTTHNGLEFTHCFRRLCLQKIRGTLFAPPRNRVRTWR
jgi:hypothetical protein